MNWNLLQGRWKLLRGQAEEQWGWLTHNHPLVMAGRGVRLAGAVQVGYGLDQAAITRQLANLDRQQHAQARKHRAALK